MELQGQMIDMIHDCYNQESDTLIIGIANFEYVGLAWFGYLDMKIFTEPKLIGGAWELAFTDIGRKYHADIQAMIQRRDLEHLEYYENMVRLAKIKLGIEEIPSSE